MKTIFKTLAAALLLSGSANAQNLILNGGFETDNAGTVIPTSWNVVVVADQVKDSTGGLDGIPPQEGLKMFQLQRVGGANPKQSGIRQTITVATAGNYSLSGWFAPRDHAFGSDTYDFTLTSAASGLVNPDGSVDPNLTAGDWNEITRTYNNLAPGVYTVEFLNSGTANLLQGTVDNFTFDFATAPAIIVSIDAFSANPPAVSPGGSSTISWETTNATSVTLNGSSVASTGSIQLTPGSATTHTLTATNENGTLSETFSLPILTAASPPPPGEPLITEFLADNDNGIVDEDGDTSDWIQITNTTNTDTFINGDYFLTDDIDDLQKWPLPNQTILPGESVFYFASNKTGTLIPHANFSLSSNGEYLALVKISGGITTILSEFNEYPRQFPDVSYGVYPGFSTPGYYQGPTPTAVNGGIFFEDFVRDTSFSIGRGFYTATQSVAITSATVGAEIYYTTDGSEPSPTNGTLYAGPIPINTTTTLRAIGTRVNQIPTNIDTHTYIFTADVVNQPTNPSGWPTARINDQVLDYQMDPGSAVSSSTAGVMNSLESIPTLSIVTDQANLLDPSIGIYVNARNRGREWERPASLEMIFPPGYVNPDGLTEGFQEDLGLRIRGGSSRNPSNPKHSFRFFFRGQYGESTLDFPLFGTNGTDEFAGFDLRTAQNYSWNTQSPGSLTSTSTNSNKSTFMREVFARDTQRDMGETHTRSRFIHLYLNGIYWGIYMTQERAEADFGASYLGGVPEDYDTIKSSGNEKNFTTETTDGANIDWMTSYDLAVATSEESETDNTSYFQIQGLNNNGTPDPAIPTHIDVENLIKYIMVVFYNGSFDAPLSTFIGSNNNWFAVRNREAGDKGWTFFAHDMEHSMNSFFGLNQDRTGPFWFGNVESFEESNPQYIHQFLANNREYRLKFADITQSLFFNDGIYANDSVISRLEERETTLDLIIDAEAARWGDARSASNPQDRTEWALAVTQLKDWTADRNLEVLEQLKVDDLYPDTDAPIYSQHGGEIAPGFNLAISHPNATGTIYYTLDGSDPRTIGGGINTSAASGSTVTLNSSALVQSRVRVSTTEWSALTSATFVTATAPTAGTLVVSEINYHPTDPTAAEESAGFISSSSFEFLEITNTSLTAIDLSGVTIANEVTFDFSSISDPGDRIIQPGQSIIIAGDTAGFAQRYPGVPAFGPFSGSLSNNNGIVDLLATDNSVLFSVRYDDNNGWPESADGDGYSLILLDSTAPNSPSSWRISAGLNGNPGTSDSEPFISGDLLAAVLRDGAGNPIAPAASIQTFDNGSGPQNFLHLNLRRYLPVDNATVTVQHGNDLQGWSETGIEQVSSNPVGDGSVLESYRLLTPISADIRRFMRVQITANP